MDTESVRSGLFPLAARVLLSLVYVVNGVGMVPAFADVAALMTSKGLPVSNVLLALTIALWLCGGACLILGWQARRAAQALFLATIFATFSFHAPWAADQASFHNELNHFLKNLAILGGLLYVITYGSGPYSLESRRVVATAT